MKTALVFVFCAVASLSLVGGCHAQEYSVLAIDAESGKPLKGITVTLRYACTYNGPATHPKIRCNYVQRKTGPDGIARFPEASSLNNIDDIYAVSNIYAQMCCDISNPAIPGTGTLKFKQRSFSELLHWVFVGD